MHLQADMGQCGHHQFLQDLGSVVFNILHYWGAVDTTICLAPKYHGNSISSYHHEFYLHLAQIMPINSSQFLNIRQGRKGGGGVDVVRPGGAVLQTMLFGINL